jgi:hypothetical protein
LEDDWAITMKLFPRLFRKDITVTDLMKSHGLQFAQKLNAEEGLRLINIKRLVEASPKELLNDSLYLL